MKRGTIPQPCMLHWTMQAQMLYISNGSNMAGSTCTVGVEIDDRDRIVSTSHEWKTI